MKFRYLLIVILSLATGLVSVAQDRDETRFIQAVQEYSSGGYERAAAAFEAILKADPSQDAAWFYLGLCRMSRQDIAGAKEAFGKAAETDAAPNAARKRGRMRLMACLSRFLRGDGMLRRGAGLIGLRRSPLYGKPPGRARAFDRPASFDASGRTRPSRPPPSSALRGAGGFGNAVSRTDDRREIGFVSGKP